MNATRFLAKKFLRSIQKTNTNANVYQSKRLMTIWYPDAKFERDFKVNYINFENLQLILFL